MILRLTEIAKSDIANTMAYYNDESPGLGDEFADEVYRTLGRIADHPSAWRQISKKIRRCPTQRFQYGVFYQVAAGEILVVAVLHLRRHPQSWRHKR